MGGHTEKLYKLSDIGTASRGKSKHRPRNDPVLYGGRYPFIQTGDVKHSNFYLTEYSQTYNEKGLAQSKLWDPDTLCITIAANIADTAILKIPACFPDSIIGFSADESKADVRFVKYCLDTYRIQIQSISRGTTQDNLSLEKLLSIKLKIPSLDTQQKIAAILSAYDDLIENNKHRIALLEKMAEEIYREWFVRMRFPGHKRVKLVKNIPVNWKYEKIGKLCSIIKRGISPSYDDNSEMLVINQRCIRNGNIDLSVARGHKTRIPKEKFVEYGDALINSTGVGTLGRISIVEYETKKLTVDSHVTICRANKAKINSHYLSNSVKKLQGYFEYMATGATGQVELNRKLISDTKIVVPDEELQGQFSDIISPIWKERSTLTLAVNILSSCRKLLLGRLISGKLPVESLDIQFPRSMQNEQDVAHAQLHLRR